MSGFPAPSAVLFPVGPGRAAARKKGRAADRPGHVPLCAVPNVNEPTAARPAADAPAGALPGLSEAQMLGLQELLRVSPVADEIARRFQEAGLPAGPGGWVGA